VLQSYPSTAPLAFVYFNERERERERERQRDRETEKEKDKEREREKAPSISFDMCGRKFKYIISSPYTYIFCYILVIITFLAEPIAVFLNDASRSAPSLAYHL
jgi:hypothetical protein